MTSELIRFACLLEASARKVGNVHPSAAFDTLSYEDFVRSAHAVASPLAQAADIGVGRSILAAVHATRAVCHHNTNLGIILLLAPLVVASHRGSIANHIGNVLNELTVADSVLVFEAIRVASPRGLGAASSEDVSAAPSQPLVEIMSLAAERDSIAAQYTTNFRLVLDQGVTRLATYGASFERDWERAIIDLQLHLMAHQPDTDIVRKCGWDEARESARRAADVLTEDWWDTPSGRNRLADFDCWLRSNGSLRNPGTTADLVTASLFVALATDVITPPSPAALNQHVERLRNS